MVQTTDLSRRGRKRYGPCWNQSRSPSRLPTRTQTLGNRHLHPVLQVNSRTLAHARVLMLWGGMADTVSMGFWGAGLLLGAASRGIGYITWDLLHDAELSGAHAAMADLAADEDLPYEAATRRSEKLQAIGSEATFFSGLARIDGEFHSIQAAVTPRDFVLFDNWTHLNPDTELARLPRDSITDAVIVDETGNEVADQLLDSIRELETPEEERYSVVLTRRDGSGALPPVSFLFRSGGPALECRDHYRGFIGPHG